MEIGVFGSPGVNMFFGGILLGAFGLGFLFVSIGFVLFGDTDDAKVGGSFLGILAFFFLVGSLTLLPMGHGRQRIGDCFDRLPAATLAVDGAFALNEEVLYIVVRGENDDGNIVRECATLPMGTVKDYPGRPVEPGEYRIVVENHKSAGAEWTTNTFVPVESE